ncbi:hypothetical protein [Candidatus Nitrotoga sp. M5]|uniref:hypothetical protein n=1 Tax=Candidatus Nitrotoga sp. M5 TaxID=2890409 RepID=UPI001EF3125E|nr:hypothetical protein [Candidatus Nitrotoga sp. M5]
MSGGRATAGYDESDVCLTTEWWLTRFAKTKVIALQRYRDYVNNMQCKLNPEQSLKDIPKKAKTGTRKSIQLFC